MVYLIGSTYVSIYQLLATATFAIVIVPYSAIFLVASVFLFVVFYKMAIPASKETFIKVDVESYECELIPSWFDWMNDLREKPTLFVSFHGHNVRCCTKEQYDKILSFSKLFKGFWYNMKKAKPEDFFSVATCTTEVVVFSDLGDKELA